MVIDYMVPEAYVTNNYDKIIPVAFHLFDNTEDLVNLSLSEQEFTNLVDMALDYMNKSYAGTYSNEFPASGIDTHIQFELAENPYDCNLEPGIDYVIERPYDYNNNEGLIYFENNWPGCVNIYYATNTSGNFGSDGTIKITTYWATNPQLCHEMAHVLGIRHLNQNCCEEILTNEECTESGDFLCDTPPYIFCTDASGSFVTQDDENPDDCIWIGNPLNGDPGQGAITECDGFNYSNTDHETILSNFMGAGNGGVTHRFTQDQIDRMHAILNNYACDSDSDDSVIYGFYANTLLQKYLDYPFLHSAQNLLDQGIIGTSSNPVDEIVVIKSGTEMTLTCDRYFTGKGGILVEPNAKLILDGAVLTSFDEITSSSDRWKGITVLGNSDLTDQPSASISSITTGQGVVGLKNGATIENTTIGIITPQSFNAANLTTDDSDLLDKYDGSTDTRGGIVISKGYSSKRINFVNNMYDIILNTNRNALNSLTNNFSRYSSSSQTSYTNFVNNDPVGFDHDLISGLSNMFADIQIKGVTDVNIQISSFEVMFDDGSGDDCNINAITYCY